MEADPVLVQVLASTALPTNADTFFTQLAGADSAITSRKRYPSTPQAIEGALVEVNPVSLFVMMLNEGNFIDIDAWLNKLGNAQSPGQAKWVAIAQAIKAICNDTVFHFFRAKILKPFGQTGQQIDVGYIEQCKTQLLRLQGVPQGVPVDAISWDYLSFKIPPVAIEFLTHRFPQILDSLDEQQIAILDQVEKELYQLIIEKCREYRQRTNTVEDDLLPDVSIYLEQQIGGMQDPERADRIARVGRGMLIQYVSDMLPVFATGNLPSSIAPAKIYSCHDIVSSGELRGTIMKVAESQVIQQSTIIDRKLIINRAYQLSNGMDFAGRDWTKQQSVSMAIKKNVDTSQRRVLKTFGVNYDQPMSMLENQLAGSSNTMGQQMEGHTTNAVLTMNEEQEEVARHTLSVLLACLRMRANATQQSAWELLTDTDLDHLEIVRFLSGQQPEPSSGNDLLYKLSTLIQEEYQNGHNVVKFGGKTLDSDLVNMIQYSLRGRAQMLVRQIPMFDQDLRSGGSGVFDVYMWCVMQSLVQRQRIMMETGERTQRKAISDQASYSLQ